MKNIRMLFFLFLMCGVSPLFSGELILSPGNPALEDEDEGSELHLDELVRKANGIPEPRSVHEMVADSSFHAPFEVELNADEPDLKRMGDLANRDPNLLRSTYNMGVTYLGLQKMNGGGVIVYGTTKHQGDLPIVIAAGSGQLALVQFLVNSGVSLHEVREEGSDTALMRATRNKRYEIIEYLLAQKNVTNPLKNMGGALMSWNWNSVKSGLSQLQSNASRLGRQPQKTDLATEIAFVNKDIKALMIFAKKTRYGKKPAFTQRLLQELGGAWALNAAQQNGAGQQSEEKSALS